MPVEEIQDLPRGLVVHYYHDIGEHPGQGVSWLHFPVTKQPYIAENVCIRMAKHLGFGSLVFPLFALVTPDLTRWLRPNEAIEAESSKSVELWFRIRFRPESEWLKEVTYLKEPIGFSVIHYCFLQCHTDFVKDVLYDQLRSVEQSVQRGLGAYAMLCYCKRHDTKFDDFRKQDLQKTNLFVPGSSVKSIEGPFPETRLNKTLKKCLKDLFASDHQNKKYKELMLSYVLYMWDKLPDYGREIFTTQSGENITVDLHHPKYPGIRFETGKKEVEHFCDIPDLTSLSYVPREGGQHIVVINRKSGTSRPVIFSTEQVAYSFMALLDGAYRLSTDWHYHLVADVESPLLAQLRRVHCYGPVSVKWAQLHLQNNASPAKKGLYLLTQDPTSLDSYLLYLDRQREPKRINRLENNQLQVAQAGEPLMDSLVDLLNFYKEGDHRDIYTYTKVPLKGPFDPGIYLCRKEKAGADKDIQQSANENKVELVKKIDVLRDEIGRGLLTEVRKGFVSDGEGTSCAAVKQLKPECSYVAEDFLAGIHAAAFWRHSAIVNIRAICLCPLSLVTELSELGDLLTYLRMPRLPLKVGDLVVAAEQLAEALRYLQEDCRPAVVHGNLCCRSVLVFKHLMNDEFKVKLTDPGLVNFYNKQGLDHPVNIERLPWIAPECHSDLGKTSLYSDCYSFGTTLWEMFSGGEIPSDGLKASEIRNNAWSEVMLPKPAQCPDAMYTLIERCWNVVPDLRLSPKEMLRDIRNVGSHVAVGVYMMKSKTMQDYSKVAINGNSQHGYDDQGAVGGAGADQGHLQEKLKPARRDQLNSRSDTLQFALPARGFSMAVPSSNNFHPHELGEPMDRTVLHRPLPAPPVNDLPSFIAAEELRFKDPPKKLGEGHYGVVEMGYYQNQTVAIKTLKKEMYDRYKTDFDKELKIMVALNHPNIVKILGYSRSAKRPMSLVLEYLDGGSLHRYLRKHQAQLQADTSTLLRFAQEICAGMLYLTKREEPLLHCDLAARNVLVSSTLNLKISDFGLSRVLDPKKDYYRGTNTKEIPVRWCAPEVLQYKLYTEKSDTWSYGVTLWELYTYGESPRLLNEAEEKRADQLSILVDYLTKGKRLQRPSSCPLVVYQVMTKCWRYNAEERASFAEINKDLEKIKAEMPTFGAAAEI